MPESKLSSIIFKVAGWALLVIFCSAGTWQANHEIRIQKVEHSATGNEVDMKYIRENLANLNGKMDKALEKINDLQRMIP